MGYGKIGFLDAKVQPSINFDDSKLLAAYDVTISEGVQYHMGRVVFAGIPANASADLANKWQLKPGAVYDATCPSEFVDKIAVHRLLEMGVKKPAVSFGLRRNAQNATVDVVFHQR